MALGFLTHLLYLKPFFFFLPQLEVQLLALGQSEFSELA